MKAVLYNNLFKLHIYILYPRWMFPQLDTPIQLRDDLCYSRVRLWSVKSELAYCG